MMFGNRAFTVPFLRDDHQLCQLTQYEGSGHVHSKHGRNSVSSGYIHKFICSPVRFRGSTKNFPCFRALLDVHSLLSASTQHVLA